MSQERKLHLGSGNTTPNGWVHIDGSWNAKLAKYPLVKKIFSALGLIPKELLDIPWSREIMIHDLTKPLPFDDSIFDAVYSSHTLEHLYQEDALNLLRESFRVLDNGGIIRIVVPDLESVVLEYVGKSRYKKDNNKSEFDHSADRLLNRLLLREPAPVKGNTLVRLYNSMKDYNTHKWMYDEQSLIGIMKEAGFKKLKRKKFLVSKIKGIKSIEKSNRVEGGAGLCVEGVK